MKKKKKKRRKDHGKKCVHDDKKGAEVK